MNRPALARLAAGIAALMLCLAVEAAPMDRYFQTSDGLKLHYLEAGSGDQTLIFIPGWLMPAAVFEKQLAALSSHYRVLAFDPRSQGLSAISYGSHAPAVRLRDMDEFLAAAGVGRFILAGWSLGVLECLDYVERYRPPGLAGLILIDNSIGEGEPPKPRPSSFYQALGDAKRRPGLLKNFAISLFRQPPPESIRQAVAASTRRVPPAAAKQLLAQPYPRTYWRDIVERLEVPILYLVTPRLRDQAAALAHKKGPALATTLVFEDAGHGLFVDAAEEFNAAVAAFAGRAFGD